jgi:acetoacetyl-CoA reductase
MARVALVTGGTRGIGAAISKALKAAGYKVAASYAGNDEAAAKFKEETGIPVYKWDVASFDACAEGIKKVEAELGPSRCWSTMPASPATCRSTSMTLDQWNAVINTNLGSLFNMTRQVIEGMRAASSGASSTSPRSTARRASSVRSIIRRRRPVTSASPRRWRWRTRAAASP